MSKHTVKVLLLGAAVAGTVLAGAPTATADPDGGVCARLNGVPFYIPPGGYMPKPGEVITGPVHAGPCREGQGQNPSLPKPQNPSAPPGAPTSSTEPSPTPDE